MEEDKTKQIVQPENPEFIKNDLDQKEEVQPQEEVLVPENFESIEPVCIACGEAKVERRGRCGLCFLFWSKHQNQNWRYEKD
ncbi:hypothetical protein HYW46_03095 [Candidatus Daviesbacteria bacterium]|nr:hypothetical protein [Candidatus Daviesbacteria bacterium]